jgi:hypothetical protein
MISNQFDENIRHLFLWSGFDMILRFRVPLKPFLDKIHRVLLYSFFYMLPPLQIAVVDFTKEWIFITKYRRIDIAPR